MRKYREYTRDLTPDERQSIVKLYENHLHAPKTVLTKRQSLRVLGLAKKERYTKDSDFWYHIKHNAKSALLDLELLSMVASDDQLEQIFALRPGISDDKGRRPASVRTFVRTLLDPHGKTLSDKQEYWRYVIACNIVLDGLAYIKQKKGYDNAAVQQIFNNAEAALRLSLDFGGKG